MKIFKNIKFLFYAILVLAIICDVVSLFTTGKVTVDPSTYALILVAICIEEVIYARNKIIEEIKGIDVHIKLNDYLISTSNAKTKTLDTEVEAKPAKPVKAQTKANTTRTKTKAKTEAKVKEPKAKSKSKTDAEILADMLRG